ncbi:MAG: hypothetical protein WBJ81_00870, partial [Rickettsiales bacterium]
QENKTEVIKELLAAGASVNNNLMVYRHNEITKFKADPVKYILTHKTEPKAAIIALKNVKHQADFANLHSDIEKTEECLEKYTESQNLNDICGAESILMYDEL